MGDSCRAKCQEQRNTVSIVQNMGDVAYVYVLWLMPLSDGSQVLKVGMSQSPSNLLTRLQSHNRQASKAAMYSDWKIVSSQHEEVSRERIEGYRPEALVGSLLVVIQTTTADVRAVEQGVRRLEMQLDGVHCGESAHSRGYPICHARILDAA